MHPLMIPGMPIEPQSIATRPEAPATLGRHERGAGDNHRRIPSSPIHEGPVVRRLAESYRSAGSLNQETIHRDKMDDDLPPLSGS
jgi:hypothetical protein